MEGEPTVLCESAYEVDDPAGARAALGKALDELDEDEWGQHFETDGRRWLRGTIRLDGDRLVVTTNSVTRLARLTSSLPWAA
jgi:hypothetical protein